jgi:hypothetical protein
VTECQKCSYLSLEFKSMPPEEQDAALRFEGWKIFEGTSLTGQPVHVILCPTCSHAPPKPRASKVLEGQDAFEF